MNECYAKGAIYGFSPLSEKEMDLLLKQYIPLIDPRFLKVIKKGREVAAFLVAIPDLADGIQEARGRLLPFGLLKIMRARGKTRQLDMLLAGVKEEYRRYGLVGLLFLMTGFSALRAGISLVDTHHVMETNTAMRRECERVGGKIYKRFRVFQKLL